MKRPFSRWLLSLLLAFAWTPFASAQRFGQRLPFEEDTQAFRYILEKSGLKAISRFDEATANPRQTVIIILGLTQFLDGVPDGAKNYVELGGAVMVATDRSRI